MIKKTYNIFHCPGVGCINVFNITLNLLQLFIDQGNYLVKIYAFFKNVLVGQGVNMNLSST